MKVSKTIFIAALIAGNLLAWSPALRAADTNTPSVTPPPGGPPAGLRGPGMRGQPNIDQFAKIYELTDDQKPKVQSILDAQRQKMHDLHQDPNFASMSPEDRAGKMKAIHDDMVAQMKAVLTPEQFDKWQKMPMAGMRGHRPGPPPGGENAKGTNAPAAPPKQ
jgi:Spy/CpxP family protein refolding chaperone